MANLRWILSVDWDNDDVLEADEGPRIINLTTDRGRPRMFDATGPAPESVGVATITLDNHDHRYTPWYTSSALYPNVKPGRRALLQLVDTDGATTYDVLHGYLKDTAPVDFLQGVAKMVIEDGWRKLKDASAATVPLSNDRTTDEAIALVLTAAGWSAVLGSLLFTGSDTLPYFWADGPADASIQRLADSEFGRVVVTPSYGLRFYGRGTLLTQGATLSLTADLILKDRIVLGSTLDNIRNAITVKAHPVTLQPLGELWRLQDVLPISVGQPLTLTAAFQFLGRPVAAEAVDLDDSITTASLNSAYVVGGQLDLANGGGGQVWLYNDRDILKIKDATKTTYVEVTRTALLTSTQTYQTRQLSGATSGTFATGVGTTIASLDYAVNSKADGTGVDMTAQLSFVVNVYSQTETIAPSLSAAAGFPSSGYLLFLRVRGQALYQAEVNPVSASDSASQADFGVQSLELDLPWQQSTLVAADLAAWLLSFLKEQGASPRVTIENRPSLQFGHDLVNRLSLSLPTIGLTHDYRIGRIQHSWKNGLAQAPLTEWTLEPADMTSYFILDTSLLDGADRLAY